MGSLVPEASKNYCEKLPGNRLDWVDSEVHRFDGLLILGG